MRPDKIFIGFALLFLGLALMTISSGGDYGGVLLIGPIPIVFGSSPQMAVTGIIIGAIMLFILYLFLRW
ncbi:MAG: TIGR00304 family membrane protein [Archaeoglobaceae archaeon]